jgi:hypothetical protein
LLPELAKFRYQSGDWNFSADGFPDRESVAKLVQSFLEMCPPGAVITNISIQGVIGQHFEIRVSWRVDPPQEVNS